MKKRINNVLAMFAVALFMGLSVNGFSQEKQSQPKDATSHATVNDSAMMEGCMSQMDSEMMDMCSKMMANMKESSSMCCNKKGKMDKKEMNGDKIDKENPSDKSIKSKRKSLKGKV